MDSATRPLAPSPGAPTPTLNLANVLYETKGSIAYVTVNRPKVLNALNTPTWKELRAAFEDVRDDPAVRGAILTGAGGGPPASRAQMNALMPVIALPTIRFCIW